MASSTTALAVPHGADVTTVSQAGAERASRPRRIDPRAGHALEILGHAIEYLADEYINSGGSLSAHNAQVEAVQLLMAANRAVYFACPPVPSLTERLRRWLGFAPRAA